MIRLNTPIESIVINLQSAGEVNYNIQYVFVRNGVTLNKSVEGILTTSGQHVVLINDYSSGYFDITYLNITNIDPAQNYISVLKKTNVNETNLTSEAIGLKNRECIEFTSDSGFKTLDQNGSFKTITSSVAADGDVENSDMSYMATVPSGGSLTLPDSQINVNGIDEGDVVSVKLIDVNLNDGIDIVVPTSVGLVGNTLTITVPASGGGDVDIEINGAPYDTVTAPATVDIPVINSALTPVGTINVLDVGIGDSSVTITDSASTLLHTVTVAAEDTDSQVIADSTIANSDASYSVNVLAEGSLTLPDQQINVNSVDEGDIPSVGTIDIDLSDGVNPVTPTSVTITGRTIDIVVPSGAPPTGDYLVRFFDIDGTILKEEWVDSGNAATAPSNPTYDSTYLTFDGWNNDFSNITHDLDVGAIYDTIDGKTYLFLKVTNVTGLQPTLQLNKSTTALLTINWGDATTNTTTSSGNVNITKTSAYSAVGDYVVSIECAANYGVNVSGYLLGNNTTYSRCLIKAYIGDRFNVFTEIFRNHTMLEILSLPNLLTTIDPNSLVGCASLIHFNMPLSVTSLGNAVFNGCSSLKSFVFSQGNTALLNNFFLNCVSLKKIILPDTTTSIGISTFSGCGSLEFVYMPSTVTALNGETFLSCRALKTINLPNNISINYDVFRNCSALQKITLPLGVSFIDQNHFRDCSSLAEVVILSTTLTAVNNNTFFNNLALKSLEFPSTLTSIGTNAFSGCAQILEYVFNSTTPPTLAATSAFTGINAACKIYVPDANVAAYQAASNWSVYSAYIYPLSTRP